MDSLWNGSIPNLTMIVLAVRYYLVQYDCQNYLSFFVCSSLFLGLSSDQECSLLQGYGALYLVTAFPVIIGISVVLILFYNSLQ